MIESFTLEWRLASPAWAWILLLFFAVLRLAGVVAPSAGWLAFLQVAYPLVLAFAAIHLIDQERRWKTLPILRASPRSRHSVFVMRFSLAAVPLIALLVVAVLPRDVLSLTAPSLLLAAVTLSAGAAWGVEWGAGIALSCWAASFLALASGSLTGSTAMQWLSIIPAPRAAGAAGHLWLALAKLGVALLLFTLPAFLRVGRRTRAATSRRT
jgi:hypothetical protein